MKISHSFGWHYAPQRYGPEGSTVRWCQWCGMKDITPAPLSIPSLSDINMAFAKFCIDTQDLTSKKDNS